MLQDHLHEIRRRIAHCAVQNGRQPSSVTLVGVTKTINPGVIRTAVNFGLEDIAENYVQELTRKETALREFRLNWHFIGHLQSNKVKQIAQFVYMVHSVDSTSTAIELSKRALENHRVIPILIQVNTSGEASKSGVHPTELSKMIKSIVPLEGIEYKGLMTIGSPSPDFAIRRGEFEQLAKLLQQTNEELGTQAPFLSMGMSDDFELAIECGATHVRVGSSIFGSRQ